MTASCAGCGSIIRAGDLFCASCGAVVAVDPDATKPQTDAWLQPSLSSEDERTLEELRAATLGDYDIAGELGRGGMASVYLAHDLTLDRKVAIKVMLPAIAQQPGMLERFLQEARTSARLAHANIIPIYAARRTGETAFFVMKYVEGRPLDSIIDEVWQIPLPMARAILGQVARALDYAHRMNVIHRDVKPANVMVDHDGTALVTDFGIAKLIEAPGMTISGSVLGTPYYMSPEQAEGVTLTGAADQYSLGVMAYEMLTGRRPFLGTSLVSLILAHREETPPPIHELRPDCPPPMAAAVVRMMAKHPADRFPSLREAADALLATFADDDATVRLEMSVLARSNPRPILRVSTPRSPVLNTADRREVRQRATAMAAKRARARTPRPIGRRLARFGAIALLAGGGYFGSQYFRGSIAAGPDEGSTGRVDSLASVAVPLTAETAVGSPPTDAPETARNAEAPRSLPQPSAAATIAVDSSVRPTVPARPQTPPVTESGWVVIGAHAAPSPVVLFVNDQSRNVISRVSYQEVRAGRVNLQLRAAGCTPWDSTITVNAGDTIVVGRRSVQDCRQ